MTIKKSITYLFVLAIIIVVVSFVVFKKKDTVEYITQIIVKGNIEQTVSETGTVKSDLGMDLSFPNSGKLEKLNFSVGSRVKTGDIVAELDYSSLEIRRNESLASLDVSKESLNKLLSGATPEEILLSKAGVDQAFKQYESAKKELTKNIQSIDEANRQAENTLLDLQLNTSDNVTSVEYSVNIARTNLENTKTTYQNYIDNYSTTAISTSEDKLSVINTVLDIIDTIINDDDAEDLIGITNKDQYQRTIADYDKSLNLYIVAQKSFSQISLDSSNKNIQKLVVDTLNVLSKTFDTLHNCFISLENSITSSRFTIEELEAFKTRISAQQTVISVAIQSIQSIEQNLNSAILNYNTNIKSTENNLVSAETIYQDAILNAQNFVSTAKINGEKQIVLAESKVNNAFQAWQVTQAQFKKLTANANKYDVNLAQAKIRQSEAIFSAAKKLVVDSILSSPIDGIVTKTNFEIGEQIISGSPVVSLIAQKKFEIEVLVTETDISKIKTGNSVQVTLDSYGDNIKFYGELFLIDPAETIIDGVIYYRTKINFGTDERSIKSGMTANVAIVTNRLENVLIVPIRALVNKRDGGVFARILKDDIVEERKIEVGIYGDNGLVEVLSGLKIGEEVVTYIKQ